MINLRQQSLQTRPNPLRLLLKHQATIRLNKHLCHHIKTLISQPARLALLVLPLLTIALSLLFTPNSHASTTPTNALLNHPSPYLAMHGQDPVQWHNWNADVITQAKQSNKLIFISSGYFSCHWCHVMQRENYHDEATAAYLNKHFISVKIDRELNPELDKTLIEFAQKATGQAGWPQHVILTPEGYPFAAFIYLPNQDFNTTLKTIVSYWQKNPEKIHQVAKSSVTNPTKATLFDLQPTLFKRKLLQQVQHSQDTLSGGLTGSTKFPQAPLLKALLSFKSLPNETEEWLLLTLDQMQNQHLFDHVHGGFYRYTIDPDWQTPHFEKMAYTNALLADIYLQAGQRYQRDDYISTAKATLTYLRHHLFNPTTQLYQSSQSAIDLHNQEGGDYLWSAERLKQTLSNTDFKQIYQAWSLDAAPPYDLGWHPIQTDSNWPRIQALLKTPATQIPIDTKSILGWNGLVLSALSRAYAVLKTPIYLTQANQLANRLISLLQTPHPPRALSALGEPMGEANLQDYAFIRQGIQDWQTHTQQTRLAKELRTLEASIITMFYTEFGWRYHSTPLLPGQQGQWLMEDNAIPSPTALVSCLKPNSILYAGKDLMRMPINYASYLTTIKQCVK